MGGDTKHARIAKNSGSDQHTEEVRISFAVSRWGMIDTPTIIVLFVQVRES